MRRYDTIVVGLGAAGATAASTLAKAGRRVLALEGQDRIGGRVMTVPFGDGVVEVGAEWVHGTVQCSVYDTAVANKISLVPQGPIMNVYKSDGTEGDKKLINELLEFCLSAARTPSVEPEGKGTYITKILMGHLKENYPEVIKDDDFVTEFLALMNLVVQAYEASNDWNDASAQSKYENLDGYQQMSWHNYGYRTFFDILLNTHDNGPGWPTLDIKLNKEVTLIKWPKDTTGDVEVICKDGDVYEASNVIVTVSLGVLKERHINLFSPPLPEEKVLAIEKIPMGVLGKIILKFDTPWLHNGRFFAFLWKGEDKVGVSEEDLWTTKISGCSTPMGTKNALTFWSTGDVAKMLETFPDDVVRTKVMELLRKFLGCDFSVPEPTGMIRSTWHSNPFTRGSYTYDNTAVHEYPEARYKLAEPLRDTAGALRVLFAGEATDPKHFSTVHGASDSGHREAMRLSIDEI